MNSADFLIQLNSGGKTPRKHMEFINAICRGMGLEIRFEVANPCDAAQGDESQFRNIGDNSTVTLLLLNSMRDADFTVPLVYEANGLIFKNTNGHWHVCCRPAFKFYPHSLPIEPSEYRITRAFDGSVVNLWFLAADTPEAAGKWIISTARGINMNGSKWFSELTYEEMFLGKLHDMRLISKLDVTKTYTFGFRHPHIHLIESTSPDLWLIAIDGQCNSEEVEKFASNGVEIEPTLAFTSEAELKAFVRNEPVGVILRNGTTGLKSNLFIESPHMEKVRRVIYNVPKSRRGGPPVPHLDQNNRLVYVLLHSYLDSRNAEFMKQKLPQFKKLYSQIDTICDNVVKRGLKVLGNSNIRLEDTPTDKLVYKFLLSLVPKGEQNKIAAVRKIINPSDGTSPSILRSRMHNSDNTYAIYTNFEETLKKYVKL